MDWSLLLTFAGVIVSSGASTAIVSAIVSRRESHKRSRDGVTLGIQWLLQDRLEWLALKHLERECITFDELKKWRRAHYIYHNILSGNGDLDTLSDALEDLYKQNSLKGE